MSRLPFALLLLSGACGPTTGLDGDKARAAVEDAFKAANPPGRTGLLLAGHSVWLETTAFDKSCLEAKDLAFNDDPASRSGASGPRISPTYSAQRFITASTPKGWCVLLGEDPSLTVEDVSWGGDHYRVSVAVGITNPTPWFECLTESEKKRRIDVRFDEQGQARLEGGVDLHQGDCPSPLPGGETRGPATAHPRLAHAGPTKDELKTLVMAFDDALYAGRSAEALGMTACFNLVDAAPFYGNCSVGEIINVGPSFHGEQRSQDGTPWAEYTIASLDDLGPVLKDKKWPGLYHATMKHKRTGKDRSFSVLWTTEGWKMVGVIGQKAESLTSLRYLYDLHRADRREVFERRLAGEELDEQGLSLKPESEEETKRGGGGGGGGVVTF